MFAENSKLTAIPAKCFEGTAIESIVLPEGIKTISYAAFRNCKTLTSVTLPSTLQSLKGDYNQFTAKSIIGGGYTVTSKKNTTSIGETFKGCATLADVVFNPGCKLTVIEKSTFDSTGLTSIELPANITNVNDNAFSSAKTLETVTFKTHTLADVLAETGKTDEAELTDAEKAKIGKSDLTSVGNYVFANSGIKTVIFPETTATQLTLGKTMFNNVTTLEKVGLPAQVSSLENVFSGCKSNLQIELSKDNKSLKLNTEYSLVLSATGDTIEFAYGYIGKETLDLTKLNDTLKVIKASAFASQPNIKKVIIPASVTTIGESAFAKCAALETVELRTSGNDNKASLNSLGKYAFQDCVALKAIDLSATALTIIDDYTFSGCSALASVTLNEGLTRIGTGTSAYGGAFYECKALREITIPASVKDFGTATFRKCTSLVTVTFNKGSQAQTLGSDTFYGCTSLKTVVLPEGLTSLGTGTFYNTGLEEFTVPATITSIGKSVFSNCKSLTSITFLGNVTEIGDSAFTATALTTFDFSSVTTIGASAFKDCTQLVGTVTTDGDGKETINAIDLSDVAKLGASAFSGCTLLEKVKLTKDDGTGLAVLPDSLFEKCSSLTQITLPSNVTFLGKNTFASSGLTSIYLPKGITSILSAATKKPSAYDNTSTKTFYNCVNLKAVTTELDGQITNVAGSVFEGCVSLVDFDFTNIVYLGGSAFKGTKIGYKENEKGEALPADYKLDLSKLKQTGSNVFEECNYIAEVSFSSVYNNGLASNVLKNCLGLKTVTFVKTTASQKLGSGMFEGCVNLTNLTLQPNFTEIGKTAFRYTAITSVEIPAKVTSIGTSAFADNANLKTVTFADSTSALTLDSYAFEDCVSLKTIVLPDRLTKIGDYAFQNCKSLNVTEDGVFALPSKLKSTGSSSLGVGKGAFAGCETIKEFSIASSNEYFTTVNGLLYTKCYGTSKKTDYYMLAAVPCMYDKAITLTADDGVIPYAFKFVKGINEITFAEGVTEIPNTILFGFTGLTTVNLPSTVVKIGNGSFNGCTSLRNVNLPEGLETIDGYAFQDCAELKIIDLPSTLTTIGSAAFSGAGLTQVILPANLTSLGTSAFSNCANLETVVLNDLLEALPDSVFQNCVKLPSIDLKNVTSIGKLALSGCEKLAAIDLTGVTAIGNNAFENAFTALAAEARPVITIPASIETLGTYLFKGAAVKEVKFDGVPEKDGVPTLPNYMFQNSTIEKVVLPEGLVTLATGTFAGCKNVDITYPASLTTIGESAFEGYEAETLTFPSTVTTLDLCVFKSAKIDTVVIPDTITTMKNQVFKNSAVRKVILGKGITVVGMMTFYECHELEEVVLPDTIVEIQDRAFMNTTKLKKLVIPAGVVFNTGSTSLSLFDGWTEDQTIYCRGPESDMENWGANWRGTGKMKVVFNYKGE